MSNIKINNLSFRYDTDNENIFENLNLNLDSSWKLGLVGRNGRGKTTFLNLLRQKLKGSGKIQTKLRFSYFPMEIVNPKGIALYELQDKFDFEEWELERELNLMKVDPNLIWQPFDTLSGGEQTKILLAASFVDSDSFPLIDEPTNHLDESSRQQIAQYLNTHDQGYIVVSHDRDFLNQITDHILAIENGEIHLYQGNYQSYEQTKENRDQFNRDKNNKLKNEIQSLNASRLRLKRYSTKAEGKKSAKAHANEQHAFIDKGFYGHKAAKAMKRSKNAERRMNGTIEDKKGLMTNIEDVPELTMNFDKNYHHTLLDIQHLDLKIQDKILFSDLNMQISNQEIVALEGKNGSGKSTLMKMLLEDTKEVEYQGNIEVTKGLSISYLPQIFTEYTGSLKEFSEKQKISYEDLLNTLKKMGFPREAFTTKIEEMSMGKQKRVAIAKSLVEPADLYLWDEPANYLDVFNQDQLIHLLKEFKPAMLLIEHDPYFINEVADQVIKL